MLKVQNTNVLVSKEENGYELVEHQIFTRKDVYSLGFSVNPNSDETVIAVTIEDWANKI